MKSPRLPGFREPKWFPLAEHDQWKGWIEQASEPDLRVFLHQAMQRYNYLKQHVTTRNKSRTERRLARAAVVYQRLQAEQQRRRKVAAVTAKMLDDDQAHLHDPADWYLKPDVPF